MHANVAYFPPTLPGLYQNRQHLL